jgi:hypothetical protein
MNLVSHGQKKPRLKIPAFKLIGGLQDSTESRSSWLANAREKSVSGGTRPAPEGRSVNATLRQPGWNRRKQGEQQPRLICRNAQLNKDLAALDAVVN